MTTQFSLDLGLARKVSGLTQRDCALLLAIHQTTLSDYEIGKRRPNIRQICGLSLIYGKSFQSLFDTVLEEERIEMADRLRVLPDAPKHWLATVNRSKTLQKLEERLVEKLLKNGRA